MRYFILFTLTLLLSFGRILAQPSDENRPLPKILGRVSDFEKLLDTAQLRILNELADSINRIGIMEIAVATLPDSFVSFEDFNDYCNRLGNYWGVGDSVKQNGVIISISAALHKTRISTANGIRPMLTDQECHDIVFKTMIPYFRNNRWFDGLRAGMRASSEEARNWEE